MAGINNKYDYRDGVLTALEVEHTPSDLRNEDEYRKKVLDGFGVEYTDDDINQKNLFREKVVSGLASGGGGGSSDFSTAEVTVNANKQFEFYVPLINDDFGYLGTYDNINPSESETLIVCLYKGKALTQFLTDGVVSVSGNAQLDNEQILITGDCTITIS